MSGKFIRPTQMVNKTSQIRPVLPSSRPVAHPGTLNFRPVLPYPNQLSTLGTLFPALFLLALAAGRSSLSLAVRSEPGPVGFEVGRPGGDNDVEVDLLGWPSYPSEGGDDDGLKSTPTQKVRFVSHTGGARDRLFMLFCHTKKCPLG